MPQSIRQWISEKVKELRGSQTLPFHEILDSRMVKLVFDSENLQEIRG